MALFKKSSAGGSPPQQGGAPNRQPTLATRAYCRICRADRPFSSCWQRLRQVAKCECCGLDFPNPAKLYEPFQPMCPRCEEFLEQPNFEYGICDGCGSKFELMSGIPPGLLPNRAQREAMNKIGRIRRNE